MNTRLTMAALLLSLLAYAQDPDTRAAEIQKQRAVTSQSQVKPDTDRVEQTMIWLKKHQILDIFSKDWYGFTPVLGGMVTGSGFGGGLQWMRRDLLDGKLMLRSSARISSRAYQLYDVEAGMPGLASDRVFLDLYLRHRNSPQLAYYGPGPGSHKQGRTDYRFEDTSYDLTGGVKPLRWVRLGGTVGYLQNNVGPGSSETYGSTERVYSPLLAPGIDRQTDFFRTGALAQIDYRDNPNGASSGGQYYARYDWYQDQELNRFSFRRMTAEAQQFVPLFNKKRVLAVRARTIFSYTDRNQRVPFYLQPSLGGSDDLRGYRAFRFYDNNSLVMNAEWRWEVLKSVEGAIFADAGKVFARPSDIDLAHLQASFGAGLRFRAPSTNAMILRLDGAISHEGFQLSLGFNDIFTSRVRTGRETSPLAGRLP